MWISHSKPRLNIILANRASINLNFFNIEKFDSSCKSTLKRIYLPVYQRLTLESKEFSTSRIPQKNSYGVVDRGGNSGQNKDIGQKVKRENEKYGL
jgi:hypothetical protein